MTTITASATSLKEAIESRNADGITAWYAEDAILNVLDRDNPPAAPTVYRGRDEIHALYADICGRNLEHSVQDLIITDEGLGYTQHCRYPEGNRVVWVTVARLTAGKITKQTAVQVWDS
jgi:SnoaL-like protein